MKRIDFGIILIIFLDSVFYFICASLSVLWLQRVQTQIKSFYLPSDIFALGYEQAQQLVGDVRIFYFMIILSFVLLLLAIILLASIFKGIIWARTTKTKLSFKLISKFLTLNLIWMGFWFLLAVLIATLVDQIHVKAYFFSMILIALYFTNNLYTIYMRKQKLSSIKDALALSFTKIHLFILPFLVVFLLFYILSKLANLMQFKYGPVIGFIVFTFIFALTRYYFSTLAENLAI